MLGDTIHAVASPPGAGGRGVLRLSGPAARPAAAALLGRELPPRRAALEAGVEVLGHRVPCLVLVMPGPRSFTGEDVVELHLPGSPLLLEHLRARLPEPLRPATPGEFSRRAYENGRLDLAEAEAVCDLIHAAGQRERRQALAVLSGGLAAGVDAVRAAIDDARGLIEAGLDFTEGETGSVCTDQWLLPLRAALAELQRLHQAVPAAAPSGEIVLLGAANAGKSALANALAGRRQLLVSPQAGTTRDLLAVEVCDGVVLLDGPGDLPAATGVDAAALALRAGVAGRAAAALVVIDASAPRLPVGDGLPVLAAVLNKIDLVPWRSWPRDLPAVPRFEVSARRGDGIAELAAFLRGGSRAGPSGRGRRVAAALEQARGAVEDALEAAAAGVPPELVAVDLGGALQALDAVHGRSTPDDVLDRIFGGFCLGK